jgi:hypothetical protein
LSVTCGVYDQRPAAGNLLDVAGEERGGLLHAGVFAVGDDDVADFLGRGEREAGVGEPRAADAVGPGLC